jgi:hypothetical protein
MKKRTAPVTARLAPSYQAGLYHQEELYYEVEFVHEEVCEMGYVPVFCDFGRMRYSGQ